ncbi:olfactory receptor 52D1-like [Eublepharis macularius]|uniref:Olfactory receptor 52D1-like n=1 Tax=Eublepharis macularius TaxID=481883 RepID=A0AA97KV58_EUBMA|nr:olfactory receptor 52D1-like [Eublepharis macularius]
MAMGARVGVPSLSTADSAATGLHNAGYPDSDCGLRPKGRPAQQAVSHSVQAGSREEEAAGCYPAPCLLPDLAARGVLLPFTEAPFRYHGQEAGVELSGGNVSDVLSPPPKPVAVTTNVAVPPNCTRRITGLVQQGFYSLFICGPRGFQEQPQHPPALANGSQPHPPFFLLTGIPGLEALHGWLSILFSSMFLVAFLGNSAVVLVVAKEHSLQEPMYIFLAMLALNDIALCFVIVPKMLAIFWWGAESISFHSCLTQMFFVHAFFLSESAILLAMAFDRYVAICQPLRYTAILTCATLGKIGVGLVVRSVCAVTPGVFLLKRLPYCRTNVIPHTYCENMGIAKLACADITINSAYGLTAAFLTTGLDAIFIVVSYVLILRTVLRLPSRDARLKAFGTCGTHVCVFAVFYTLAFFSFFTHRFGPHVPHHVHILLASLYLLVPPALNPIVYGVKTKEIRVRILGLFCQKGRSTAFGL